MTFFNDKIRLTNYGKQELTQWAVMLSAAALFCLFADLPWLLLLCVLGACFILYFFRDPIRHIPEGDELIVSPADGKISAVDEVDEPNFIGGRALRISIFLNVFNVHVNRAPVAGHVDFIQYKKGDFHSATSFEKSESNESNYLGLCTPAGIKVGLKQISGLIARRIVCETRQGTNLDRGEQFGMIKFGSRTDIFIPIDVHTNVEVEVGDLVKGGSSILGRFVNP